MEIAVLGAGRVGSTLARRWSQAGKSVVLGSRDPVATQARLDSMRIDLPVLPYADAAASAEVVLLALPYEASLATAAALPGLAGKVVIDCCNPLNASFDGLTLGYDDSAAERIAKQAPGAYVVKAFNCVSLAAMENPFFEGGRASVFYCGDDPGAKRTVDRLSVAAQFDPHDAGPLKSARYLEPLAMLYIHLAIHENWKFPFAFAVLKRGQPQGA